MLGLDHYCGSLSKLDSYIKGGYKYTKEGKEVTVQPMHTKILNGEFCNASWVDLLFSSNVHILGLSLDFSELDLWWVLNKRARLPCKNKIYYYTNENDDEKNELLKSFGVKVVYENIVNNDFQTYYKNVLKKVKNSN